MSVVNGFRERKMLLIALLYWIRLKKQQEKMNF